MRHDEWSHYKNRRKSSGSKRFERMLKLKQNKDSSTDDARAYTSAMLGIQVYSHKVYLVLSNDPHAKAGPKHKYVDQKLNVLAKSI